MVNKYVSNTNIEYDCHITIIEEQLLSCIITTYNVVYFIFHDPY